MPEEYNEIEITLPKPPSLNHFYSGKHWSSRSSQKVSYYKHIKTALESIDAWTMDSFSISLRYNCRYDVDNAIVCTKFLSDYLRNNGYVKDDTPKYFKSQRTQHDSEIPKDTFIAKMKCYGYKIRENDRKRTKSAVLQGGGENTRSGKRNVRSAPQQKGRPRSNARRNSGNNQ